MNVIMNRYVRRVLTALPHRAASDLVCAVVLAPCAVPGLLCVAVAVCRADTLPLPIRGAEQRAERV